MVSEELTAASSLIACSDTQLATNGNAIGGTIGAAGGTPAASIGGTIGAAGGTPAALDEEFVFWAA